MAAGVHGGHAVINVGMVPVGLIVSVGQESEPDAVAGQDGSGVRILVGRGRADHRDLVARKPFEGVADAVAAAVAGVIVRGGDNIDAGDFKRVDHFGLGLEHHAGFDGTAAVGER